MGEFRVLLLPGAVSDFLDQCPSKRIDLSMWEGVGLLDGLFHREDISWRWRQSTGGGDHVEDLTSVPVSLRLETNSGPLVRECRQ